MMSFRLKVILGIALVGILALAGLVGTSVFFAPTIKQRCFETFLLTVAGILNLSLAARSSLAALW